MPNRGEKEQYYVKETHEPIIEKSVFDNAQKLLATRDKSFRMGIESSIFYFPCFHNITQMPILRTLRGTQLFQLIVIFNMFLS